MPRKARELSALVVSRLGDDGFHVVGDVPGLGLHIAGEARSWVLRFSFAGRRPEMGLGCFPEVSLAQARQKAKDARELVRKGINPIDSKQAVRRATATANAASRTFGQCAANYIDAKSPEWVNVKHLGQAEHDRDVRKSHHRHAPMPGSIGRGSCLMA